MAGGEDLPRPGSRLQNAASGLYIALVMQIPAVTALVWVGRAPAGGVGGWGSNKGQRTVVAMHWEKWVKNMSTNEKYVEDTRAVAVQ